MTPLFLFLVVLFTFLFGGAGYEAYRFVRGAWNYTVLVMLWAIAWLYELKTKEA